MTHATTEMLNTLAVERRSRRQVLRAVAGGAALVGGLSLLRPADVVWAAGKAEALLLNCIDYRLTDSITTCMKNRGLTHEYDQIVLAGASLGAQNETFPDWGKTFFQHVQVAIDLHAIEKVIIIDHRDCGAYTVVLGQSLAADPENETAVHARQMKAARATINERFPELEVELLLMALDGTVEPVA